LGTEITKYHHTASNNYFQILFLKSYCLA
jgi:hypothetical protein